ncbi:CarD family transcriptional regulator [Niabella ginsenosidivorans]|uniref:CarD family transcriptional regulator n=1 Tax=Niabella ginsenosidivorans TaxID=1176587 RepID=A0A1A9I403_9BACT|nr:Crp/Fnr family transcriptional regulator [Niabella ginsenosidivorans]ANH82398.1 CarD family transcriptional regulator [Niabella ginsenosidivorans]
MGYIREFYERFIKLEEPEWRFIAAHFQKQVFQKQEHIIDLGETENYLSFIESGLVRFYIPGDEREWTFHFNFHKEFTGAYDSFLTRTPATYRLQALSETMLWRISYEDLQEVYTHTRAGNFLGRFIAERMFLTCARRTIDLVRYNATERYLQLLKEEPRVLQQVPLKYVASYIGITPQALSRIRRQIS